MISRYLYGQASGTEFFWHDGQPTLLAKHPGNPW